MSAGRLNLAGSTVLVVVLKLTIGVALAPAIEPRVSVCLPSRMFVPNLKLCGPVTQLRLLTNW